MRPIATGFALLLTASLTACASAPSSTPAPPPGVASVEPPSPDVSAVAAPAVKPPFAELSDEHTSARVVFRHDAPIRVYAVDGAAIVAPTEEGTPDQETPDDDGNTMLHGAVPVGRLSGGQVQWFGKIEFGYFSLATIDGIQGRWPDQIGVMFRARNGTASGHEYQPMNAQGAQGSSASVHAGGPGAGVWWVGGASVGASTLGLSFGFSYGATLTTVHGPKLERKMTPWSNRCAHTGKKALMDFTPAEYASALQPTHLAATRGGTLVALGKVCDEPALHAEVWEPSTASRLVDLSKVTRGPDAATALIPGSSDDLWLLAGTAGTVYRFHEGKFAALPKPPAAPTVASHAAVGPNGDLYVSHDKGVMRFDGAAWYTVLTFADPRAFSGMALDDTGTVVVTLLKRNGVYSLAPR